MDFAELVDAQLEDARELVGTGSPPQPTAPGQPVPQPTPPAGWSGLAQRRAAEQSIDLGRTRDVVDDAKVKVQNAVARVESVGPRALQQTEQRRGGVGPGPRSPEFAARYTRRDDRADPGWATPRRGVEADSVECGG